MSEIHEKIARSHPKLVRGKVWCRTCGTERRVNTASAMSNGWPKCCGFTMTLDAPSERDSPLGSESP